jgi:uncharacterized membrane protein
MIFTVIDCPDPTAAQSVRNAVIAAMLIQLDLFIISDLLRDFRTGSVPKAEYSPYIGAALLLKAN